MPNYWGTFDLCQISWTLRRHVHSISTAVLLGLALALAAMCYRPDRLTRAFAILTLAATVWMFGDSTPIGRAIFLALPVSIRIGIHPEYTLPVFALGIAVLAGLGANRFLKPRWRIAAGAIIAIDLLLVSSDRPFNVETGIFLTTRSMAVRSLRRTCAHWRARPNRPTVWTWPTRALRVVERLADSRSSDREWVRPDGA